MSEHQGQEEHFVAVHGGAGFHHPNNDKRTKRALRLACTKALQKLSSAGNFNQALTLIEQATISLEDDTYLNAGYGSNLTMDGTVECDAAVHLAHPDTSYEFGSVGAVSGIKNPISAARSVLEYSRRTDRLGRVPPMTLVSDGAVRFVKEHGNGIICVPPEDLVSPSAKQVWKKWKDRLEAVVDVDSEIATDEADIENLLQDTVGAVAWHPRTGFAAGVSSGGMLLKFPGRVGEAAVFGAGCWAHHEVGSLDGMACSISGTGEEIVRAKLAQSIGDAHKSATDLHTLMQRILVEHFWRPAKERGIHDPAAGVLMITRETADGQTTARVWCGFTTASMAIAFASSKEPRPKAYILRRQPEATGSKREKAHVFITSFKI